MKKGIYSPMIVILTFVLLVYATSLIYMGQGKYDNVIGKTQLEVIDAYNEGEMLKFYTDEAAKLARDEAIFELGERGGNFECGVCYLNKDVEDDFIKLFKKKLKDYDVTNENIFIKAGKIIGRDEKEILIDVKAIREVFGEEYSTKGIYYVDNSFKIDLDYDFKIYNEISNKVGEVKGCLEDINEGSCIEDWKIERGDPMVIEVSTGKKVLNNFKLAEVKIKFNYKRG